MTKNSERINVKNSTWYFSGCYRDNYRRGQRYKSIRRDYKRAYTFET